MNHDAMDSMAEFACCSKNCRQGRDCPKPAQAKRDTRALLVIFIATLGFWGVVAMAVWARLA